MKFNPDMWLARCLDDFVAFKSLSELIRDEAVINNHVSSFVPRSTSGDDVPDETASRWRQNRREEIGSLVGHFGALTVVGLCTTFEVAAREFFASWFMEHPKQLHNFLHAGNIKGVVPLSDILSSDSKGNLLSKLSDRSASVAATGKYSGVITRAEKLSKVPVDEGVREHLDPLQKMRNEIVHEKAPHTGDLKEISAAHQSASDAILYLAKVAHDAGVPGFYSCVDPIAMVLDDVIIHRQPDA